MCIRDRDSVYGNCLPKSPQPTIGAWRAFDERLLCQCAQDQHEERLVSLARSAQRARGMYISGQSWVGVGGWGVLTERERLLGGKASWGWAAEGAARQCINGRRVTAICADGWQSIK